MFRINIYLIILLGILSVNIYAVGPIKLNEYFVSAARTAKTSMVNITIYRVLFEKGKMNHLKVGYGSGTIISRNGYIVTNHHVLKKGDFFQIILFDGTECNVREFSNGKYYIADEKTDLALLHIEEGEDNLTPIMFEDPVNLSEGEWVLAVGNPYGLKQSITCGIISSKGRNDIGFADIEDFIQTDVPINPGNSGGPLVNLRGRLVGINTAIRTVSGGFQGISFAIPSNIVKQVCNELIKHGRVRRGWLGFLAKERGGYNTSGKSYIEVISVMKKSPAFISGIQKGDIIREIDGKRITTLGELIKSVGNKPVGSKLKITISRDGELYKYCLILREKQKHKNIQKEIERLFSLYGIELGENSKTGDIVVSYLSPMGIAYQNGLKRGDLVISINGKNISTLDKFVQIFKKCRYQISQIEVYRESRLLTINFL